MDSYPPSRQRPALLDLAKAIGSRDAALRRDDCGDWQIEGRHGKVYAVPGSLDEPNRPGFQIFVSCETEKAWTYAKRALAFAGEPTNDGDEGGAFILHRLPSPAEAELLRRYVGIEKKRDVSAETLERLRRTAFPPRAA